MAVPCGVLDLDVSEQDLDEADVLVMLQKMRGERMPLMPHSALAA
jgi:hypothetical protein